MSEKATFREKAEEVLAFAYRGIHHVPGWPRAKWTGEPGDERGVAVNVLHGISTFDFDTLTRLVVAAHDQCVRLEIVASGPRMLKLVLSRRVGRSGDIWERHPRLEEHAAWMRETEKHWRPDPVR